MYTSHYAVLWNGRRSRAYRMHAALKLVRRLRRRGAHTASVVRLMNVAEAVTLAERVAFWLEWERVLRPVARLATFSYHGGRLP